MRRDPPPRERSWGSLHPLLDLHGLTGDEAVIRAESWLRSQRARGERTAVVVTGRGNRSPAGPVLRGEIEHLLIRLRGDLVHDWGPAEGGGAVIVQLSAEKPPRRSAAELRAAERLSNVDPRLRARAEEALWELGITPTPALVDAEIRRIRESGPPAAED
jgi:hypothetical protein